MGDEVVQRHTQSDLFHPDGSDLVRLDASGRVHPSVSPSDRKRTFRREFFKCKMSARSALVSLKWLISKKEVSTRVAFLR